MSDMALKTNDSLVEKKPRTPAPRRLTFAPRVDILERADELVLFIDLPGVKPEDVELHFERGELTVTGRRQPTQRPGRPLVDEYEVGEYHRAFLISQDVAADRISAELKHGVLTVRLPRSEATLPRKIAVKGA